MRTWIQQLLIFTTLFAIVPAAQAVISVGVGPGTASNVTGSGDSMIIYGGLAGTCAGGDGLTCNSCTTTGGGDAALVPCNTQRIYQNLGLLVTISSSTLSNGTALFVPYAGGSVGSAPIAGGSTPYGAAGTTVTLNIPWGGLCGTSGNDGSTGDPTCTSLANGQVMFSAQVGVSTSSTSSFGTSDDFVTIQVFIEQEFSQNSTPVDLTGPCNSTATDSGVCYFSVGSGDNKAYVITATVQQAAETLTFTPTSLGGSNPIPLSRVRFFYASGPYDESGGTFDSIFNQISNSSPFIDVNIQPSVGTNALQISPYLLEGGINNGPDTAPVGYFFKSAMVDAAMNVGFFTPASENYDCNDDPSPPTAGKPRCHIAVPGPVVGLLSNDVNCFIATASYGSDMAPEVLTFRKFRDKILERSWIGKEFVHYYYEWSPPIAHFIAKSEALRTISRAALWPMLWLVKLCLHFGPWQTLAIFGLFGILTLLTFIPIRNQLQRTQNQNDSSERT